MCAYSLVSSVYLIVVQVLDRPRFVNSSAEESFRTKITKVEEGEKSGSLSEDEGYLVRRTGI
jgi:hypothetical protein